MNTYIGLLRGINVGGRNSLPMKDLIGVFEGLGATAVRTYIQSGNVVFRFDEESDLTGLSAQVADEIQKERDFRPQVLILSHTRLKEAMERNPFPEAESEPRSLHLGFLAEPPASPDTEKLEQLRKSTERFRLIESAFYLHAPDGIGRSKLAARAEKSLGVPMTMRNWRTVRKIRELAEFQGPAGSSGP